MKSPVSFRRLYFVAATSIVAVLFLFRFFILPRWCVGCAGLQFGWGTFVAAVTEETIKALVVSVFVAAALLWLSPQWTRPEVTLIDGVFVGSTLRKEMTAAREWRFRGGTGSFTKSDTLPLLAKAASLNKHGIRIWLEIIDPTDEVTCERYARYRTALTGPLGITNIFNSAKAVAAQSYATILLVTVLKREQPFLDICVGLSSRVSPFRLDMTDSLVLITNEDQSAPCLRFDSGSVYYRLFRNELDVSFEQARKLTLDLTSGVLRSQLAPAVAREQLSRVGALVDNVSDAELEEIIKIACAPPRLYV
jgi:hypothetical protein